MKLAFISAHPYSIATLNKYGLRLAKQLAQKAEVDELVLISDQRDPIQLDNKIGKCKISIEQSRNSNSSNYIFNIYRNIVKHQPDAILFNFQFNKTGYKKLSVVLGFLLPLVFRLKGIPTFVTLHKDLEDTASINDNLLHERFLYNIDSLMRTGLTKVLLQADTIALTSEKYMSIIREKYNAQNLIQIPQESFKAIPEPNFDLPNGPKKILTFGKFGKHKKVEALIEAIIKLRASTNQELEIVIAGTDHPTTPGYLAGIMKQYDHIKNLTFTGFVDEENVAKNFKESTLVVLPYTSERVSSGMLLKAAVYGKAVVIPNFKDLALNIKKQGFAVDVYEPGDVDSLGNFLKCIIVNDSYRRTIGEMNYKASCSLPMEKIAQLYLDEFQKLFRAKMNLNFV